MAISLFPERDCANCTLKNKGEWGCEGGATELIELDGELMDTCIRRPVLDNPELFNEAFAIYNMFKAGFLPNEGSYLSQPPSFLQLVSLIESTLNECDGIKESTDKAKADRKAKISKLRGQT